MKKKLMITALSLCLGLSMAACASGGADSSSAVSTEAADTGAGSESAANTDTESTLIEAGSDEADTSILPTEIKDGEYEISVDSSSTMFRIVNCTLTVKDGLMQARMEMGGKGYLYLYMGTSDQAEEAPESEYIPFEEEGDAHFFTVPVEALDREISVCAFSKRKQKWYDRTLVFRSDRLEADATPGRQSAQIELSDGDYTAEVTLTGGSGRTTVESPARLTEENGSLVAEIIFSSPHYDYVKMGDETYYPINTEGNSTFMLPVEGFDREIPIIADTTAMSKPHEIEYTLRFDSSSIKENE